MQYRFIRQSNNELSEMDNFTKKVIKNTPEETDVIFTFQNNIQNIFVTNAVEYIIYNKFNIQ